jgi:hypothetical protein
MPRTIRANASVVGALMIVATGAATSSATVPSSSAVGVQQVLTQEPVPHTWGDWLDCAPTEAGGSGSVGWEVTTASRTSANLDQIQRIRFSSECPGIVHAMTFDTWGDPQLIRTAEIDFVGPVDVTLSQSDLRALGLSSFQPAAALWPGSALVRIAPDTRGPETTVLGTFGPGTGSVQERCDVR